MWKIYLFSNKKTDEPIKVQLPQSYYKGQEEKRKYAESEQTKSVGTQTASTFYPVKEKNLEIEQTQEQKAKNLLNTSNVPASFPKYNSAVLTDKEYQAAVAKWLNDNPSYRKKNN